MKIEHHPDASTLMSYSAGSLPEALSAVVAAHLDVCPDCALEVETMDRIGASLFERIESVPMLASCSEDCGHLRSDAPAGSTIAEPSGNVLTRLLGRELSEVHWKRLGFRIWHYPIKLSPGSPGDLRLIKVAPDSMTHPWLVAMYGPRRIGSLPGSCSMSGVPTPPWRAMRPGNQQVNTHSSTLEGTHTYHVCVMPMQ